MWINNPAGSESVQEAQPGHHRGPPKRAIPAWQAGMEPREPKPWFLLGVIPHRHPLGKAGVEQLEMPREEHPLLWEGMRDEGRALGS